MLAGGRLEARGVALDVDRVTCICCLEESDRVTAPGRDRSVGRGAALVGDTVRARSDVGARDGCSSSADGVGVFRSVALLGARLLDVEGREVVAREGG